MLEAHLPHGPAQQRTRPSLGSSPVRHWIPSILQNILPSSTLALRNPSRQQQGNEGEEHPWDFTPGWMLQGEGSPLLDQSSPTAAQPTLTQCHRARLAPRARLGKAAPQATWLVPPFPRALRGATRCRPLCVRAPG